MPGAQSRWSAGKDLSWEPLRIERVCEVKYDHMQGDRFRHAAIFLRWRPDKQPRDCRYDQLEVTSPTSSSASSRRDPKAPERDADPAGRSAGSRGCASRCCSGRASRRRARPRAEGAPPPSGGASSSARGRPGHHPCASRGRFRSGASSVWRAERAAARRPASCIAAATAHRPGPGARTAPAAARANRHAASMPACRSPIFLKRAGMVASVKSAGSQSGTSSQVKRRRHARVRRRAHRVRGSDGAVLRVLVVVDEHAVALLLPPLAGGELRRATLDLARQRQRRAAHLVEAPSAARCARRYAGRACRRSSASR